MKGRAVRRQLLRGVLFAAAICLAILLVLALAVIALVEGMTVGYADQAYPSDIDLFVSISRGARKLFFIDHNT